MKPSKFSNKNREYIKWGKNTKEVRIFPKASHSGPAPASLQVEMDAETAQGVYSNLASVSHTETEFALDFLFLMPGQARARVRSRVISTPLHTKRLGAALRENIQRYEDRFGPIKI